ncbi:MAG TPA: glycosyltransferase family 9 protein [Kiloniellales bacterium]|jgi:ADP-heptose:LPS heptosyltransferase
MAANGSTTAPGPDRILVIKLSALGDFILSLGAFRAIRAHHPDARIVLLTTPPFVEMANACGCFDEVWTDDRPHWLDLRRWLGHIAKLRRAGFTRVYDLQRSQRTGWYFRLLGPRPPEWVGSVPGCSHRYVDPPDAVHITVRNAHMLAQAGIAHVPQPDLSFMRADIGRFAIQHPYALLVPGSSAHRPDKRWPAALFAELAKSLAQEGITPVLVGGPAERDAMRTINQLCPQARDLCGQTDIAEMVTLASDARVAIGNDTGPLHVVAAAGCPTVALFGRASHPIKTRPPAQKVTVLQKPNLADVTVPEVLAAIAELTRDNERGP